MAINFNHVRNTISSTTNVIEIESTGALKVPAGLSADRPSNASDGQIRYNASKDKFEFRESGFWKNYSNNIKFITQISGEPAQEQYGDPLFYSKLITSNGADNTVHITLDGTVSGNALFQNLSLCQIQINPILDTESNNESPWVHIRGINGSTLRFQVKRSNSNSIEYNSDYPGNENNTSNISIQISIFGLGNTV